MIEELQSEVDRLRDANKQLRRDAERSSELEQLRKQLKETEGELKEVKGKGGVCERGAPPHLRHSPSRAEAML